MSAEVVLDETADGVARLTIDRPERRNAFGRETVRQFALKLTELEQDSSLRVLVLGGSGGHFGSGADLKERASMTPDERFRHSRAIAAAITSVSRLKVPTIAAVDGYAVGGGCELALACDIRLLSDRAVMALTETRIGALPAAGGTQRLTRLVGPAAAKELIFSGRHVQADEALRLRLANAVVPADALASAADELAATIAANSPLGVALAKQAIDLSLESSLDAGLGFESAAAKVIFASDDYAEGLASFGERRAPRFQGT
jgi:enoyl-CoA hydratase/carnithine racemase